MIICEYLLPTPSQHSSHRPHHGFHHYRRTSLPHKRPHRRRSQYFNLPYRRHCPSLGNYLIRMSKKTLSLSSSGQSIAYLPLTFFRLAKTRRLIYLTMLELACRITRSVMRGSSSSSVF